MRYAYISLSGTAPGKAVTSGFNPQLTVLPELGHKLVGGLVEQ